MEQIVVLFAILVGIEAVACGFNIISTFYNMNRDKCIQEAQKSINILSKRINEMQTYYEGLMTDKSAYIRDLRVKIQELENQLIIEEREP